MKTALLRFGVTRKIITILFTIITILIVSGTGLIYTVSKLKSGFNASIAAPLPKVLSFFEALTDFSSVPAEAETLFHAPNQHIRKSQFRSIKTLESRLEAAEKIFEASALSPQLLSLSREKRQNISLLASRLNDIVQERLNTLKNIQNFEEKLFFIRERYYAQIDEHFKKNHPSKHSAASADMLQFQLLEEKLSVKLAKVASAETPAQVLRISTEISQTVMAEMARIEADTKDKTSPTSFLFRSLATALKITPWESYYSDFLSLEQKAGALLKAIQTETDIFLVDAFSEMQRISDGFNDYNLKHNASLGWILFTFIALLLLNLASLFSLLFYVYTKISYRLFELRESLAQIQKGHKTPINTSGHDEISDLAKGILYFTQAQEKAEKALAAQITELSNQGETLKNQKQEMSFLLERLEAEKQNAEDANKAKTSFLANMSHELRTPLNAIIGFSELIKSKMMGPIGNPQYEEYIGVIHTSGNHLLSLINDILDLAKIESGKATLIEEVFDVKELSQNILMIAKGYPNADKLSFKTNWPMLLPRLKADRRMINQILLNFLSNAIKFTPTGGAITLTWKKDTQNRLTLSVRDTGIGVPKDKIDEITKPFTQVDSSLSRKYKGTGLGLTLTKELATLHGATFKFESQLGNGSIVSVTFPPERTISA